MLKGQAVVDGWATFHTRSSVPGRKGGTLEAQAPVAGIAPKHFLTGSGGARGLTAEARLTVSLCRLNMREDVLGVRPKG